MLELPVLIGLVATVFCFLKGRRRAGLAAIATGVLLLATIVALGDPGAGETPALNSFLWSLGMPLWAVVTLVLMWPAAEPGSYWDRRFAVDGEGNRLLAHEPLLARFRRSLVGGLVGVLPAVVFMVGAASSLEGDDAQIGFIGIPLGLFGLLLGGWIGFNWVPRQAIANGIRMHQSA